MQALTNKIAGLLIQAWEHCDENDKSTEYMLQYMQDVSGVDLDTVVEFIRQSPDDHTMDELRAFWSNALN